MGFAHEAEVAFASILDAIGIPWEYEPTTFVLEKDESGATISAFCPDFFLPEQNLYVELTAMKDSNRKNRKIRMMADVHPDVRVVLLRRRTAQLSP